MGFHSVQTSYKCNIHSDTVKIRDLHAFSELGIIEWEESFKKEQLAGQPCGGSREALLSVGLMLVYAQCACRHINSAHVHVCISIMVVLIRI